MDEMLDLRDVAAYTGLPLQWLAIQVKHGQGPVHVKPSPKKRFFRQTDVDAYIATWRHVQPDGSRP